jgi:hypothetical protein
MEKPFEIPGKFSIDLADVTSASYDADLATIWVRWKDPRKKEQGSYSGTKDDFAKLQKALSESPAATVLVGRHQG